MLSHHLGVGVRECPPCGGEFVGSHGNRILKLGRGGFPSQNLSTQPFSCRSTRSRPHPSGLYVAPGRSPSPENPRQTHLHEPGLNEHPQVERRINPVGVLKIFREPALRGERIETHALQQNNIARRHLKHAPAGKLNLVKHLKHPLRNQLRRRHPDLLKPRRQVTFRRNIRQAPMVTVHTLNRRH